MNKIRYVFLLALTLLLVIGLVACGNSPAAQNDIITQKSSAASKMQITVLVKYAFTINGFEKAVEDKFPNVDIIQVGNFTRDIGVAEYESRLKNDDLTDIVMTWPLDVGSEYWDERLIDLSGMEFTSRYNLSMLNEISTDDGKLFYLPGPAQVRGIIYNSTLFKENNWAVPQNYNEFIKLCKTIEKSGMRSLQLGFGNSEVLDTAFIGYSYGNCFSKPQDMLWLEEYNNGKGSLGDQLSPALDTFQKMIDEGIWKKSDLDVFYQDREKMLFNRECAMVEDSVLLARMGHEQTGTTDEFKIMPFFSAGDQNDWARLYMVCYVGLNKKLEEAQNKEKYDVILDIMDYISTTEGQNALSSDTGAMFSSLIGATPPDIPEIDDIVNVLSEGRYGVFPAFKNSQQALSDGLKGMLNGTATKEDVIKAADLANKTDPVLQIPEVLGNAEDNFTLIETGNFVTDVMRRWSSCDIALFMDNGKDGRYNGKGISASLYKGELTETDINRILPDLKHGEKGVLWKVSMTGENLMKTLEYSIPVDNNITGWFYYFSGLKVSYSPVAEPGSRIKKISDENGEEIKADKVYSIAVMDDTVPEEYIIERTETDSTIHSILVDEIKKVKTIAPSGDNRFTVSQ